MCPGCRAILDADAAACPYCGWEIARTRVRLEGGLVERGLRGIGGPTGALLALNLVLYAVTTMVGAAFLRSRVQGEEPSLVGLLASAAWNPPSRVLVDLGALVPELVIEGDQWWRLLCPVFLHGGLLHLLFNMSALRQVGPVVEDAFGGAKALGIYLIAGLGGSAASLGWFFVTGPMMRGETHVLVPRIGASGAILGFAGVLLGLGWRIGGEAGRRLWRPMLESVGFILVLGVVLAFTDAPMQIDNAAHVGGLVVGLVAGLTCSFGVRAKGDPAAVRAWDFVSIALALGTVASFIPVFVAMARAG